MRRGAFTLVEALVVIAIVALLLAIALPALRSARARARTTVCLTRSREIAAAVNAFSAAHAGRLPENRTLVAPGEHVTWRHTFAEQGYVPRGVAWTCPAHPGEPASELGGIDRDTRCVGDVHASYALNGHVLWRGQTDDELARRPDTAIARPTHTILIAETRAEYPDLRATNALIAADDDLGGVFSWWHAGDGVYAFIDGHAETIHLLDTGSPDCRWHNGDDLSLDPFNVQDATERRAHDHPDWPLLIDPVYAR